MSAYKLTGLFCLELHNATTGIVDRISLENKMPLLGVPATHIKPKPDSDIQVEFSINHPNMVMETGKYYVKVVKNDNNNFGYIHLVKKLESTKYEVFLVPVHSVEILDNSIKVQFNITQADLDGGNYCGSLH